MEVRIIPQFDPGKLLIAQSVADQLPPDIVMQCFFLHLTGIWGDISKPDKLANWSALKYGGRLVSAYSTTRGRILIITEADRSLTAIFFERDC